MECPIAPGSTRVARNSVCIDCKRIFGARTASKPCIRYGELAAVFRERVVGGTAGRRSSTGEAASCQVMSPGLSSVVSSTLW